MRTRNKGEIINLIFGFAESDDRIRAVVMNGSRGNPNVIQDPFQGYNIATFVTDVALFRQASNVVLHFGEVFK